MYCVAGWMNAGGDGWALRLPRNTPFLLLAESDEADGAPQLGILDVPACGRGVSARRGIVPVPRALEALIDSGKRFPPALANARDILQRELPSAELLLPRYEGALSRELTLQRQRPYFLAASRVTEMGYREAGEYYWVVEVLSNRVRWVSADYFIYEDALDEWRL